MAPGAPAGPLAPGAQLVNVPLNLSSPLDQYAFQASLTVPITDYFTRVTPGRKIAKFAELSAENQLTAVRLSSAAEAKLAYYGWARARLGVIVAEQALAQSERHLADAKAAFEAGSASQADVLRLESQVAKTELLVLTSRNLSERSEEQLRVLMHAPEGETYRIGEDIRRATQEPAPSPLSELWARALDSRPELRAVDAAHAVQDTRTSLERAAYLPRLALVASAEYSNPNQRVFPSVAEFQGSWAVGTQASWTLSDIPVTRARVRAQEARASATLAERAKLVDAIRLEVVSARQAVEEARAAARTTARGLAAAEESYRARRLLYENDRATSVELIDAETDLTRARLDALGAQIDARVAAVRLAYAVGIPSTKRAAAPEARER
jgi:outer membrane protein